MGTTFSGTYLQTVTLSSSAEQPATVTGTITVTSGNALYGDATTAWSITNFGLIRSQGAGASGGYGIYLLAGGDITNQSSATVTGYAGGILIKGAAGTVVNGGQIVSSGTSGFGVDLLASGAITNLAGGTISGNRGVGMNQAGTLTNAGSIVGTGQYGIGVALAAPGIVVNQTGGTISGNLYGIQLGVFAATVTNDGAIDSGYDAVLFRPGYTNRLIVGSGASFSGRVDGGNTLGAASVSTLELASGASAGTLSGIGTQFIDFAQITVDSGARWTLSGSNTIAANQTLALNGVTLAVSGTLEMQGTLASNQTLAFAGAGGYLHFDNPTGVAGGVIGFAGGETIDLNGVNPLTVSYSAGQLHFGSGEAFTLSLATAGTVVATASTDGAAITICFCANALIRTPSGERPVQQLAVGDPVTTYRGETRHIAWIGTGKVLATRGRRNAATPVIVRRGALADNVPHRDLRVTKGHALYLDDALIPVEYLVNHRSIEWDDRAQEVELYHIELETHDVLIANGAPAESYRDDGNRWLFRNANSGWGLPPQQPCAPILTGGPVVDAAWRRLLDRAGARPGLPLIDEPDVHLLVDGQRLDAAKRHGDVHVFRLPTQPGSVRIVSRAAAPQELGLARDPRVLGVALRRIVLSQGRRLRLVEADDGLLADGFHAFEPDNGFRWTDGDAALPAWLFADFSGAVKIELHVGCTTSYVAAGERHEAA